MRYREPNWVQVGPLDSVGRRGLWMRTTSPSGDRCEGLRPSLVELCSGREGDDSYVALRVGAVITEEMLHDLDDALDRYRSDLGPDEHARCRCSVDGSWPCALIAGHAEPHAWSLDLEGKWS